MCVIRTHHGGSYQHQQWGGKDWQDYLLVHPPARHGPQLGELRDIAQINRSASMGDIQPTGGRLRAGLIDLLLQLDMKKTPKPGVLRRFTR